MPRPRLSKGGPIGPILEAAYHNQIADVLAIHEVTGDTIVPVTDPKSSTSLFLVRNDTGEDLDRYSVLNVNDQLFSGAVTEDEFQNRDISFAGQKPSGADDNVAILLEPCKKNATKTALFQGWVQCKVDVTDATHKFAKTIADDHTMLMSAKSGFPMIPLEGGTGEKWCSIGIGTGGAGVAALFEGYTTAPVDGGDFDVENINEIFGSYSDTETTGNLVQNRAGWIIDAGGWVVVVVDQSNGELICIQAECPPNPNNYMNWTGDWQ